MAANFQVFLSRSTIGLIGIAGAGGRSVCVEVDALPDTFSFLAAAEAFSSCFPTGFALLEATLL